MNHDRLNRFLATPVALQKLELLIVDVPQRETFVSAVGVRQSRLALIVKWYDRQGVIGYGECASRPDPFYSHEYLSGAVAVLREFLFPLIQPARTYGEVLTAMQRVRGWPFTRAAVEFALNDAIRRGTGMGILEHSGLEPAPSVPVGISLGMFADASALCRKLEEIAPLGYRRLKFKISPEYRQEAVLSVLGELDHPYVAFDANGSFGRQDFALLARFARMQRVIEQPFAPGHLPLLQAYRQHHPGFTLCLDEDIEHLGHLQQYAPYMAELNLKPGRVGGLYQSLQIIDYCRQHRLPVWIGGMFETGIGRTQNLQLAARLPEARAHDLSPSGRYFRRDVLARPVEMTDGLISRDSFENPEVDEKVLQELQVEKTVLKV